MIKEIELDGVTFKLDQRPGHLRDKSDKDAFVLVKTEKFLEYYDKLKERDAPKDIMEVGMFEGGSLVYLDKLFQPTKLVGLDLRREPIEPLEAYREGRDHIVTYYGRSQDQEPTLQAARENFPTGIDLVIDDASHLYAQTRATFEMLFPLVRKGGTYIIEDWAWSHTKPNQEKSAPWYKYPAMSNLIFELTVLAGQYGVIDSIEITRQLVAVTKGAGTLPGGKIDLDGMLRGKKMVAL